VRHLQEHGFATKVTKTSGLDAIKKRFGVPDDLAFCHTAEEPATSSKAMSLQTH